MQEERQFNLDIFNIRINELDCIKEVYTRKMLVEEIRHILTNLPYNHVDIWSESLRGSIFSLLDILRKEIDTNDENFKKRILDMLNIIAKRTDDDTLKKMENDFLNLLNAFYEDQKMEKTSDLIRLLQILNHYDSDYMEKLIKDSLEKWNIDDFNSRYNDIEIDRYLSGEIDRLKKLRLYVLKKIEVAKNTENLQMEERYIKMYDRIR